MPSSAAPFVWAAMARLNGSRFRKRVGKTWRRRVNRNRAVFADERERTTSRGRARDQIAKEKLSFRAGRETLARFFATL